MNYSYKLKIRQQNQTSNKDETMVRRIRTDHLDVAKKTTKQPLADNRKVVNHYNQSSSQVTKPSKKATVIKSVLSKNTNNHTNYTNYSRLTTEPAQRPHYLQHHRTATATDKLTSSTNVNRKTNTQTTINFKKKQPRESSTKVTKNDISSVSNTETSKCVGVNRYQVDQKVGSGTFGTVHKARDKKTLETVAIKKVYQDKNYKNRELDILKMLLHPNVLSMKDSFFTYEQTTQKQYLNVVMDYYELNLYEAVKKCTKKAPMPKLKFKIYAYQMFRSLLYLRSLNISHRDIKPQNILVD